MDTHAALRLRTQIWKLCAGSRDIGGWSIKNKYREHSNSVTTDREIVMNLALRGLMAVTLAFMIGLGIWLNYAINRQLKSKRRHNDRRK